MKNWRLKEPKTQHYGEIWAGRRIKHNRIACLLVRKPRHPVSKAVPVPWKHLIRLRWQFHNFWDGQNDTVLEKPSALPQLFLEEILRVVTKQGLWNSLLCLGSFQHLCILQITEVPSSFSPLDKKKTNAKSQIKALTFPYLSHPSCTDNVESSLYYIKKNKR